MIALLLLDSSTALAASGAGAQPCARDTGERLAGAPRDLLDGTLKRADGTSAALRPAKAYVLYFGAQWCGPCRLQVRAMKPVYEAGDARRLGYEIVFVSGDQSSRIAQAYAQSEAMPWPYLPPAASGRAEAVANAARNSLPDLVVVDAGGRILCRAYTPEGRYLGVGQTFQAMRRMLGAAD